MMAWPEFLDTSWARLEIELATEWKVVRNFVGWILDRLLWRNWNGVVSLFTICISVSALWVAEFVGLVAFRDGTFSSLLLAGVAIFVLMPFFNR